MNAKEHDAILKKLNEMRMNTSEEILALSDGAIVELAEVISAQDGAICELAEMVSAIVEGVKSNG